MSRQKSTFKQLREQNERDLSRAESDLSKATLPNGRRSLPEVLERRIEIEGLATTQRQREFYGRQLASVIESGARHLLVDTDRAGAREWHARFVRLIDPVFYNDERFSPQKLRAEILKCFGNSRFVRFQELFSHDHQFIIPVEFFKTLRENLGMAKSSRLRKTYVPERAVVACLVAADRIPDALIESLGLVTFNKREAAIDRLRKKADLNAVNGLKLIFDAAVPINRERSEVQRNNRVLVIQPPTERVASYYMGALTVPSRTFGTILYTREINNGKSSGDLEGITTRHLSVQHFTSVYAARRKTRHQSSTYQREIDKLSKLSVALQDLNLRLDTEWKPGLPIEQKRAFCKETTLLMGRAEEILRRCADRYKVGAITKLREISVGEDALLDSRRKPNIAPCMSKVAAARLQLGRRFAHRDFKGRYNEEDHFMIREALAAQEEILEAFGRSLVQRLKYARVQRVLSGEAWANNSRSPANSVTPYTFLGSSPTSLSSLWLRPFTTFGDALLKNYRALETALADRNRDGLQAALIKIHVIKKFFEVNKAFERVKDQVIEPDEVKFDDLRSFISRLRKVFSEYQVIPERIVPGYAQPFKTLEKGLQQLERGLVHYRDKDLSDAERRKMFKRLKKFLDDFAIEDMVRDLP